MKLKFKLSCGLIIIIIGCLLHIAVYAESEDMITNTLEIINYDLKTKTETKESYVSRQKTNDISAPAIKPNIAKPFWIVGDDDRKPLLTLSEFPYSTVCFIYNLYKLYIKHITILHYIKNKWNIYNIYLIYIYYNLYKL